MNKNFEANGWRSKDGKFNWARLGVDGAAAAVVGAGVGILTNVLMKKSQLKSGYESIQCTYGNGGTAAYGDTFILK